MCGTLLNKWCIELGFELGSCLCVCVLKFMVNDNDGIVWYVVL